MDLQSHKPLIINWTKWIPRQWVSFICFWGILETLPFTGQTELRASLETWLLFIQYVSYYYDPGQKQRKGNCVQWRKSPPATDSWCLAHTDAVVSEWQSGGLNENGSWVFISVCFLFFFLNWVSNMWENTCWKREHNEKSLSAIIIVITAITAVTLWKLIEALQLQIGWIFLLAWQQIKVMYYGTVCVSESSQKRANISLF